MDRSGSTVDPGANLFQVLNDSIDMYGYPDPVTNAALVTRTLFALVPYFVYTFTNDITAQLQAIGGLGAVAAVAIRIVGDLLYVATNIPAQIVARLTGVTGASIFPLFPPEPPSTPSLEQATLPDPAILACDDGSLLRATCIAS